MGEIEDIFGNQVISKAIILRGTPDWLCQIYIHTKRKII
jgi:hypothetical protein